MRPIDGQARDQVCTAERFLKLVVHNPLVGELADRAPLLGLPDTWVVSGCLFQTAWNVLSGRPVAYGIQDYDLFYYDPSDLRAETEAEVNRRAAEMFSDLDCTIDIRNQARVHLWYEREFGVPGYPPLKQATDGIDRFLAVCCMVAIRRNESRSFDIYAPFGVDDILNRVMRPNPWYPDAPVDCYNRKALRWRAMWPELEIEAIDRRCP